MRTELTTPCVRRKKSCAAATGQPNGWYFTERYVFQDFRDFTPDPTECAVYIVRQNEKALFDEADYLITDFGNFAAVYPRYWAE